MPIKTDPIKVDFEQTREDGAGTVILTATTAEQKLRLFDERNIFKKTDTATLLAMAAALSDPVPYVYTLTTKDESPETMGSGRNRGWFLCTGALELEWSTPYFNLLSKRTGWTGRGILPDVELTGWDHWLGICATGYNKRIWTEHGHFCYEIVVSASEWNKRTPAQNAAKYAKDKMIGRVADQEIEREYIPTGTGLYKLNPRYANGVTRYLPRVHSEHYFHAFVDWWLENEANDVQREAVRRSYEINAKNHKGVSDLHNIKGYGDLRWSWNHREIKWETFHTLTAFDFTIPKEH